MKKPLFVIILFFTLSMSAQQSFMSDSSFGNNGVATLNSPYNVSYKIIDSFIRNDGKILIFTNGQNFFQVTPQQGTYVNYNQLARLNSNGSIDTGFGVNGYVDIVDIETYSLGNLFEVAGGKFILHSGNKVRRFNENGSLDLSFGNSGFILLNNYAKVNVQNDGKIIVASINFVYYGDNPLTFQRYTSDGVIDTLFNPININYSTSNYSVYDILFRSDGKILLCIMKDNNNSHPISINIYNADGSLENSANLDDPNGSYPISISLFPNNKLLVTYVLNFNRSLKKFNSDLTVDTTFGTNGVYFYGYQHFNGDKGIYTDNNDKILYIAGTDNNTIQSFRQLLFDGNLDFSFNGNGIQALPIIDSMWFSKKVDNTVFIYSGDGYNSPQIMKYNLAGSLAINQFQNEDNFNFYPNPALDFISLIKEFKSISIFSIDGKLMYSNKSVNEVNVSFLSKGTYIINTIDENGVSFSEKLIKL